MRARSRLTDRELLLDDALLLSRDLESLLYLALARSSGDFDRRRGESSRSASEAIFFVFSLRKLRIEILGRAEYDKTLTICN